VVFNGFAMLISHSCTATSRASRLLLLLLGLFLVGFVALITLNLVVGRLMDDLKKSGDNERARVFIGEELVRTIKEMELDFNRMFASSSSFEQIRLNRVIKEKTFKLEHDLLVLQDGGQVKRTVHLNIEGVDNLVQQVTFTTQGKSTHNLLELIEVSPLLDNVRNNADVLVALLEKQNQARDARNVVRMAQLADDLNLRFKHVSSLFIRLNENSNRLFYASTNRISDLEVKQAAQSARYKQAQVVLAVGIISLVMGTSLLMVRQLAALNSQLEQTGNKMREAKEEAESANQLKSESLEMLEQEMAERQKADEALQRLNASLENLVEEEVRKNREKDGMLLHQEKLASIGQLAAGVAHEINNPMGFIMANLNTLKEYADSLEKYFLLVDESLPDSRHPAFQEAKKQLDLDYIRADLQPLLAESTEGAERVRRIVMDLKDFARPDEQAMHDADLNHLLQSTINIVRNELKYVAQLDLQLGELPRIVCHPQQINQVVSNLLVNAAYAIEQQGTITVRTWQDGDLVVLSVADTGKGILPENMNRIFDPFFTTKDVGKGTGLGLSISYDIVKKHGGEIAVESTIGVGTTFTVKLPVDQSLINIARL
jgi:signal transduction histidine kinase